MANTAQPAWSLRHTRMMFALPLARLPCGGYDNLRSDLKERARDRGRETEEIASKRERERRIER
eukprot:5735407-Alexandrium_andersonii.AAC.1